MPTIWTTKSQTCSACLTICGIGFIIGRRMRASRSAFASGWRKLSGDGRAADRLVTAPGSQTQIQDQKRRTGVSAPHKLRTLGRVGVADAGQREHDDEGDEGQNRNSEDAAFGAGGTAAQEGSTHGVCGEKMVLRHHPTVGDAVEVRLRPIPRGVKADSPPERTGAPQTETENHPGQTS